MEQGTSRTSYLLLPIPKAQNKERRFCTTERKMRRDSTGLFSQPRGPTWLVTLVPFLHLPPALWGEPAAPHRGWHRPRFSPPRTMFLVSYSCPPGRPLPLKAHIASRLQGTNSTGCPSNQHHTQHTMKYQNIHPVDEDFIRRHSEADEQHVIIVNVGKPVNRIGKWPI